MAATCMPRVRHRGALPHVGYVYVIRLAQPLGNPANMRARARFYVGWALDPKARLAEHRAGRGAKMLAAAVERGITFRIICTVPGTRRFERKVKDSHNVPQLLRSWRARGIVQ